MKKYTQIISLLLFCLGFIYIFRPDEYTLFNYVTTDYARVEAVEVHLAPAYEGYLQNLSLQEGDLVAAGDSLFSVYNSQLEAETRILESKISLLERNNQGLLTLLKASDQLTRSRKDSVLIQDDFIQVVEKEDTRVNKLLVSQLSSSSDADRTAKELLASRFKRAEIDIDVLSTELNDYELQYKYIENQSLLAIELSELDKLSDLKQSLDLVASFNGQVSRVHARNGAWVDKGEQVLSIVNRDRYWIVAHFKESALHELFVGQEVLVFLDSYPDRSFQGRISGFQPQTTANKNIFPFEKTAGSFIKVTQRIPVNIEFTQAIDMTLVIGQSAVIKALRGSGKDDQ